MATIINVHEAKTHLSRILERVRGGEEIVLAKAGKPYAKLVAIDDRPPRTPGLVEGMVDDSFFDPLPEELLEAWES